MLNWKFAVGTDEIDLILSSSLSFATAKILKRTSVFDRLGAESKTDTVSANKVRNWIDFDQINKRAQTHIHW